MRTSQKRRLESLRHSFRQNECVTSQHPHKKENTEQTWERAGSVLLSISFLVFSDFTTEYTEHTEETAFRVFRVFRGEFYSFFFSVTLFV